MKPIILASTLALTFAGGAVFAQSSNSVRVQPGHFCALNKCVRFSNDLNSVKIQSRQPVSIRKYGLRSNPVISSDTFREIFFLALRQPNITSSGR